MSVKSEKNNSIPRDVSLISVSSLWWKGFVEYMKWKSDARRELWKWRWLTDMCKELSQLALCWWNEWGKWCQTNRTQWDVDAHASAFLEHVWSWPWPLTSWPQNLMRSYLSPSAPKTVFFVKFPKRLRKCHVCSQTLRTHTRTEGRTTLKNRLYTCLQHHV